MNNYRLISKDTLIKIADCIRERKEYIKFDILDELYFGQSYYTYESDLLPYNLNYSSVIHNGTNNLLLNSYNGLYQFNVLNDATFKGAFSSGTFNFSNNGFMNFQYVTVANTSYSKNFSEQAVIRCKLSDPIKIEPNKDYAVLVRSYPILNVTSEQAWERFGIRLGYGYYYNNGEHFENTKGLIFRSNEILHYGNARTVVPGLIEKEEPETLEGEVTETRYLDEFIWSFGASNPIAYTYSLNMRLEMYKVKPIYDTSMYLNEFSEAIDRGLDTKFLSIGYGGVALNQGLACLNKYQANGTKMIPLIGRDVTNCERMFNGCVNIIGKPSMRTIHADSAHECYRECRNLTGEPEIGQNIYHANYCYYNCINITGNAPDGLRVARLWQTFWNCQNLDGHTGYYPSTEVMYQQYYNCFNIHGDAVVPDNCTNADDAFFNCYSIDGTAYVGNRVTRIYRTFYDCRNLRGDAACGPLVVTMEKAYWNCFNLDGNAVCGPNVTSMVDTYQNCHNLKNPVCGDKVTTLERCYQDCHNMTGAPFIGNAVTGLREAYMNCYSLTGTPSSNNIQGFIVSQARNAFRNCRNIHGTAYFNRGDCYEFQNAFRDCTNLQGVYIRTDANAALVTAASLDNCVSSDNVRDERLNIVFRMSQYFGNFRAATTLVNNVKVTWSNIEVINTAAGEEKYKVNLPYTYNNGKVYGYKTMECLRRSYNQEYNIYAYSVL